MTDDEVQLLLNIMLEYKLENVAEGVDWEVSLLIWKFSFTPQVIHSLL
jgi:hypothetical protein